MEVSSGTNQNPKRGFLIRFILLTGLRLTQVLKKYNLHRYTSFIRLFDDLEEELNNKTNKTFMVPTNQAMETIWQDYLYDDDIGKKAYAMIKYHILEGVIARNDFVNYRFVETESSIQVRLGYTIPVRAAKRQRGASVETIVYFILESHRIRRTQQLQLVVRSKRRRQF